MDYLKQVAKRILKYEAQLVLKKYKPKVIAITGSVGKTLTKEAIYLILSKKYFVRMSEKSFTAELGVPLTIIGCHDSFSSPSQLFENIVIGFKVLFWKTKYPDWLILEIDGDKPGDLSSVSSYVHPDILVMTAIGEVPSHIELFYDLETFAQEKQTIINAIKKDGCLIYNADDRVTNLLTENVDYRKVSCGVGEEFVVSGSQFEILYGSGKTGSIPTGMSFNLKYNLQSYPINIFDSIGVQNEYAVLLAFAVGKEFGLSENEMVKTLSRITPLPGRMNFLPGIKDTIVIDDSYNSSPIAMAQAIDVLRDIKSVEKKVAVIGDMMELGRYSTVEHRKAAEALRSAATHVICIGIRTRKIVEELLNYGFSESNIMSFDTVEEVGNYLQNLIDEGDIILIKGSQAMRMEKAVEEIMRYPEDKGKVLVRQEPEWLNRTQ